MFNGTSYNFLIASPLALLGLLNPACRLALPSPILQRKVIFVSSSFPIPFLLHL